MSQTRRRRGLAGIAHVVVATVAATTAAAPPTPGYPEPVIQWGVQRGETCEDVATAVYGSTEHVHLLLRYNPVTCTRGAPLREGSTLVLPAAVTEVPTARIDSLSPTVRARPPGGGWSEAAVGQPLATNSNVNTRETGRASIGFADRTRVVLAENTLVVIYGTASRSVVARDRAPAVEVEEGEARAALAALRGGPASDTAVAVAVAGGRVNVASTDTVIEKKGPRATVSVFDGSATVESAGRSVVVPRHHASRFVERQPPSPPRPLPAAPSWSEEPPGVVLALGGPVVVSAAWSEVPRARAYRVEIARDAAFTEVALREEVPARVRTFRAEGMPAGAHHLRVRAIDDEDYLGLATTGRVRVVEATARGGAARMDGGVLRADPGAVLVLTSTEGLEAGGASGTMAPAPATIALGTLHGTPLWLRADGGRAVALPVAIDRPPPAAPPPPAPAPPASVAEPRRWIGPTLPLASLDDRTDVLLMAPTARDAVVLGGGIDSGDRGDVRGGGRLFAAGSLGPAAIDGILTTSNDVVESAWLGGRIRVVRAERGAIELAPLLRLGLPTRDGAVTRMETGLAVGGDPGGAVTWVGRAGLRVRLGEPTVESPDALAPHLLAGLDVGLFDGLRALGALDAQLLVADAGASTALQPAGGVTLGVEAGRGPFLAGASGRFSPFFDPRAFGADPLATVQLVIGVREPAD